MTMVEKVKALIETRKMGLELKSTHEVTWMQEKDHKGIGLRTVDKDKILTRKADWKKRIPCKWRRVNPS